MSIFEALVMLGLNFVVLTAIGYAVYSALNGRAENRLRGGFEDRDELLERLDRLEIQVAALIERLPPATIPPHGSLAGPDTPDGTDERTGSR